MDPTTLAILRKRHAKHRAAEDEKAAKLAAETAKAEYERLEAEASVREIKRLEAEEAELKAKEENTTVDLFLAELSDTFSTLAYVPDLELSLQMMAGGISSIIDLIKSNNRMDELKMIVVGLVEILNKIHENSHKSAAQVRMIKEAVQQIFSICEVEIEIEAMDTSEDETTAKKFQAQEYEDHGEHPYYAGGSVGGSIGGADGGSSAAGGGGQALPIDDAGGMPPLEAYPNEVAIGSGNVIAQTGEH
jgi:hypothetical protein